MQSLFYVLRLSTPANWSDWLLALGRDGVRRAIYATSDAVSFAMADRREELSSAFDLYQPSLVTMMCILDKGSLHQHARAVGIETPETWFPQSADEADRIVREVGGQIVAKPRSQLSASSGAKGDEGIYSLSGFRDMSGSHVVMQAALKIPQQPRNLGIGLCFEEAPLLPDIAQQTIRLCERIGYYSAFELEFIVAQGRMLLIDFNGRFYNQLAFDIARGMDFPAMVYAGATDATEELERLISCVSQRSNVQPLAFCNGFSLSLSLTAQKMFKKNIQRGGCALD